MRSYAHSLDSWEFAPPENEAIYMNKPLPAPPVPRRNLSQGSFRNFSQPGRPVTTSGHGFEHSSHIMAPPIPRRSTYRESRRSLPVSSIPVSPMPVSSISERRSSPAAKQLSVDVVGIRFDWSPDGGFSNYASPVFLGDETASNCHSSDDAVFAEREARYSVPTLVSDCDDNRSKRSSNEPRSPHAVSDLSLKAEERELYGYAPDSPGPVEPVAGHLDAGDSVTNSYNYFSDPETSDEYHRFTTNLAKFDKQRDRRVTITPIIQSQSLTSRLSFSARSLFSRRRDPPRSSYPADGSLMNTPGSPLDLDVHAQTPRALQSDKSSINSASLSAAPDDAFAVTRSVFEDSDDEETDDEDIHLREVLREFFTPSRRSSEETSNDTRTLNRKSRKPNLRANIQAIPE